MTHRASGYRPVSPTHLHAVAGKHPTTESKFGRFVSSGSPSRAADESPSTEESPPSLRTVPSASSSMVRSPGLHQLDEDWSGIPGVKAREVVALGSGAYEAVRLVWWQSAGSATMQERAFKPQTLGPIASPQFCKDTGIDRRDPRTSERSEAFSRLDRCLHAGVVPDTRRLVLDLTRRVVKTTGTSTQEGAEVIMRGQRGVSMQVADGIAPRFKGTQRIPLPEAVCERLRNLHPWELARQARARGFTNATLQGHQLTLSFSPPRESKSDVAWPAHALVAMDFSDPMLRKLMVRLQWLDFIGAQVDRHGENYAIARDTRLQVTAVSGWDNDFSFGAALGAGPAGVHLGLPPPDAVDASLCAQIRALARSEASQLDVLGPALGHAELQSLRMRLQVALDKLDELERRKLVLDDGPDGSAQAWRSAAVGHALGLNGIEVRVALAWRDVVGKTRADGPESVVTTRRCAAMREKALAMMGAAIHRGLLAREATEQAIMLWWWNGPMQGRVDPIRRPVLVLEELWGLQPASAQPHRDRKSD